MISNHSLLFFFFTFSAGTAHGSRAHVLQFCYHCSSHPSNQIKTKMLLSWWNGARLSEGHLSSWASTPDIWLFDEPIHSEVEIKRNVSPGKIFIHGFGSRRDVPSRNGDKVYERFDKCVPDSKTEDSDPGSVSAISESELSRKKRGHGRLPGRTYSLLEAGRAWLIVNIEALLNVKV